MSTMSSLQEVVDFKCKYEHMLQEHAQNLETAKNDFTSNEIITNNLGHLEQQLDTNKVRTSHIDALLQGCTISSALAMKIAQSYTNPNHRCDDVLSPEAKGI